MMNRAQVSRLLDGIVHASSFTSKQIGEKEAQRTIANVKSIDDIHLMDEDMESPIWNWLPAVTYCLFGLEAYKEYRPLKPQYSSLLLIPPTHLSIVDSLMKQLLCLKEELRCHELRFTQRVSSLLYGGFPWFPAYFRTCEHYKCYSGTALAIVVPGNKISDSISFLLAFKNQFRNQFAQPLRMEFQDLEFPGIINAFHTPNHIENRRHLMAVGISDMD